MLEVAPDFHPVTALLQFGFYAAWLMFLGWKLSDIIRGSSVPVRGTSCIAAGIAISWTPTLLRRLFDVDPAAANPVTLDYLLIQIGAPLAALFLLCWWLDRRRDDDDLKKIFE